MVPRDTLNLVNLRNVSTSIVCDIFRLEVPMSAHVHLEFLVSYSNGKKREERQQC